MSHVSDLETASSRSSTRRADRRQRRTDRARKAIAACATCLLAHAAGDAWGQTFTWTNAAGGTFNVAGNWSPAGGPPNSATESAVFGPLALYTVTFTGNITNQNLTVGTSFANFTGNGAATTPTYSLAGDATLTSGLLIVGAPTRPLNISLADLLTVTNNALTVQDGSHFTAARMSLSPPTGSGTISVNGLGTTFAITSSAEVNIGGGTSAGTAAFGLGSFAAGTFAGPLSIVQTSSSNQFGRLNVSGGASLTAQSSIRVGTAGGFNQRAQINLSGPGSRITQTGTGTIAIGAALNSRGIIQVSDGATFTTGTGTVTVNELGTISVIGGRFENNGTLVGNGGLIEVDGGGLNSNVSTTLAGGTLLIGKFVTGTGGGFVNFDNSFAAIGAHIEGDDAQIIADGTAVLSGNSTVNLTGDFPRFVAGAASFTSGTNFIMNGGSAAFGSLTVTGAGTDFSLTNNAFSANGAVAIISGAALSVTDSSTTMNSSLTVNGGSADATFTNGTTRVVGPVSIGAADLNFVGGAATFQSTTVLNPVGRLNVASAGFRGNGTLTINGGTVSVGPGATFNSASFTSITNGTFNMTGGVATFANSLVTNNANISVGTASTLVIPAGNRTFTNGRLALVGTGTIDFTGRNLTFTNSAEFSVATFEQPDNVINFLGSSRLTGGTYRARGTTRFMENGRGTLDGVTVGQTGPALFVLEGPGAGLTLSDRFNVSSMGTADFSNGATLAARDIFVSSGDMTLRGGANANTTTGRLSVTDAGRLTVTGPGTKLAVADGAGFDGTMSIANGASVSITGTIGFGTSGFIDLSGGTFLSNGSIIISQPGAVFRKTGGVFHLDIAHTMEVSNGGVAEFLNGVHVSQTSNIFNVFDGGTLRFADGVRLGEFGVFGAMSGTGSITVLGNSTTLSIGASGATVGFGAGGRGTIEFRNGGRGTIAGPTHVGVNNSSGTLLVNSGGSPTLGDVYVGVSGGAGFVMFGGSTFTGASNVLMGNFTIGDTGGGIVVMEPLADSIAVTQTGAAALTIGAPAPGFVTGSLTISGGTFTSGTGQVHVRPGGMLTINGGGRLVARGPVLDNGANLVLNSGSGRLDLTDQTRFIDYAGASPVDTVRARLTTGYANGSWNGTGIMSSAAAADPNFAIGYAEATELFTAFPATFQGRSVDATTLLVTYTRYGDANLDRVVNLQDFNRLAINFGVTGTATWAMGDFNYDRNVNLADFNRLASNFGLSAAGPEVTPQDWANLAAAVPEPAAVALLPVAAAVLCGTRRRRVT